MNTTKTFTSTKEKQLLKEKDQSGNCKQHSAGYNDRTGRKKRFDVIKYYRALIHVSSLK